MRIMICGSMSFAAAMAETEKELEKSGHEAEVPYDTERFAANPALTTDGYEENYMHCVDNDVIRKCFNSIAASDAILVLNYPKNGINGYIGASVMMEIGIAYFLGKKIFLLHAPPKIEEARYSHELLIMQPIILEGNLDNLS